MIKWDFIEEEQILNWFLIDKDGVKDVVSLKRQFAIETSKVKKKRGVKAAGLVRNCDPEQPKKRIEERIEFWRIDVGQFQFLLSNILISFGKW